MKNRKMKMISLILVLVSLFVSFNVTSASAITITGTDTNGFTWQSDDGVTYSITGYNGSDTNITIPSSIDGHAVTSIGSNAFREKPLTSVTIPDTVTSIGGFAFYCCSSLVNIAIPNSVTSIGDSAFAYCTSLANITLPSNLSSIGNSTFQDCKALKGITIPDSVTSIGIYAFVECYSLTDITIPNSVTSIGEGAFKDCKALRSAVMPDSVTSIGNYLFYNDQLLSNVRLSNNLTDTGNFIFYNDFSLTGVTLPSNLKNIGNSAFENCTALTNITIPTGVTRIGYRAFIMCRVLSNVTIPNTVKIIDFNAFAHCYAFTNIIIPEGVTSIGDYAFYYDTALTEITIPQSVTSIGFLTFSSCNSNFKIKGYEGSYAQIYAGSNSITFQALSTTEFQRLSGLSRYETSVEISKAWGSHADYIVLATGEDFPDALCAAPLATKYGAPILLTLKNSLPEAIENEIDKLKPQEVFLIGGTGVISDNIKTVLQSKGIKVTRISGVDRYDTSLEVAKYVNSPTQEAFIVTGDNYPDALSIASYAGSKQIPILLTDKSKLNDKINNYIRNKGITKTYVIGGTGVVSDNVLSSLPNAERIYGSNRYETNYKVLSRFSFSYGDNYFATGESFADALSGSALAGVSNNPIILVGDSMPDNIVNLLKQNKDMMKFKKILGGTGAVSDTIINKIFK
ncbi:leucine-rich repeat protein [Clostridium paridis]|uniref:Leucine-rich repeat protein n=1 Tax=Clostridium paridis TaxID=2803863 RepID=A0A937FJ96_9CLOT|nr:leucine-rich repeat protein [Clostridium paridis]MBL4932761.1 leucine-rich repeat protein [Clostridium paridis]